MHRLVLVGFTGMALLIFGAHARGADDSSETESSVCHEVGTWLDLESGAAVAADQILNSLADRRVVLLGESHDKVEDHLWQLHTLAGLHAHNSDMIVGFEMFPRAVQPALDAWSEGTYNEAEFLEASRWAEVWGYAPELYAPLFHFARQNRLPMIALNVDRQLVSRVGREGWAAVPVDEREGVSDPAAASEAYRQFLARVYVAKQKIKGKASAPHGEGESDHGHGGEKETDIDEILESDGFARFVEAQLTWDRAMAEALFQASREQPDGLVVGIMGRGHIERGYGVPHQLADLGESNVAIVLPMEADKSCQALGPDMADVLFITDTTDGGSEEVSKPRLGVIIETVEAGVRVLDVTEDSVAAVAGLEPGDIIISAAGFPVARNSELIEIIQRQAPGTWLPLEIRRDGEKRKFIAEFPNRFE